MAPAAPLNPSEVLAQVEGRGLGFEPTEVIDL